MSPPGPVAMPLAAGVPCRGHGSVRKEEFLLSPLLVGEAPPPSHSNAIPMPVQVLSFLQYKASIGFLYIL